MPLQEIDTVAAEIDIMPLVWDNLGGVRAVQTELQGTVAIQRKNALLSLNKHFTHGQAAVACNMIGQPIAVKNATHPRNHVENEET